MAKRKKKKRKNPYLYPGGISFMDPWERPAHPAVVGYPAGITASQIKAGDDGLVQVNDSGKKVNPMAKRKNKKRAKRWNSGYIGSTFNNFDPAFDRQLRQWRGDVARRRNPSIHPSYGMPNADLSYEEFSRGLGPATPASYDAFSAGMGPRLFPDSFGGEHTGAGRLRPGNMGLPGYVKESGESWNKTGKTCSPVKQGGGKAAPASKAGGKQENPRKRKCKKCKKYIKPRKGPGRPAKYHKACRPK